MTFVGTVLTVTLGAVCVVFSSAFSPQSAMFLHISLSKASSVRRPLSIISMTAQKDKDAVNRRNLLQRVAQFSVASTILGPIAAKVSNAVGLADLEEAQIKLFQDAVPSVCFISTEYTSKSAQLNVDPTQPPAFRIGDKVEGQYRVRGSPGFGMWYSAKIVGQSKDGKWKLEWKDGDAQDTLKTENELRKVLEVPPKGVGSGIVWDSLGHVVTNFHVINRAESAMVTVTRSDGTTRQYVAKLTGVDPDTDLAVLKIDAPPADLRKLPVGQSRTTKVGQLAFAIGNPFGQDHTLSRGVISGMNERITSPTGRKISGVIETDAAINPGNSGGPLLDRAGRVIGIIAQRSAGVGFAIPIDTARQVVEELIAFGQAQRAILGISYLDPGPTELESEKRGIPRVDKGVVVFKVQPNSPGAAAGLQAVFRPPEEGAKPILGDVIVSIDKFEINSAADLEQTLAKFKPGDMVVVQTLRGPEQAKTELKVKLGAFRGSSFTKIESERGAEAIQPKPLLRAPQAQAPSPPAEPELRAVRRAPV